MGSQMEPYLGDGEAATAAYARHFAACVQCCIFSSMAADKIKLSSTTTVARYRELELDEDRQELARFVCERFYERYFRPIESTPQAVKHGFTIMAVCCIVIETLESFYQGLGSTANHSSRMFQDFFSRSTSLSAFAGRNDWFYRDIRCGILHQSEARGGWRVLRSGPLLDVANKRINATRFIRELRRAVDDYAERLPYDDALWALFRQKMKAVCDNCV